MQDCPEVIFLLFLPTRWKIKDEIQLYFCFSQKRWQGSFFCLFFYLQWNIIWLQLLIPSSYFGKSLRQSVSCPCLYPGVHHRVLQDGGHSPALEHWGLVCCLSPHSDVSYALILLSLSGETYSQSIMCLLQKYYFFYWRNEEALRKTWAWMVWVPFSLDYEYTSENTDQGKCCTSQKTFSSFHYFLSCADLIFLSIPMWWKSSRIYK